MITEDYVSFEIAKLLKEKGFDGKCYKVWVYYTSSTPMLWAAPTFVEGETIVNRESVESAERTWNTIYGNSENKNHGYLAPTLQMVMKWLREVHNLFISIVCCTYPTLKKTTWTPEITTFESVFPDSAVECDTYEQACESAIKYCLENLI